MSILKIRRNDPHTTATAEEVIEKFSTTLDDYAGKDDNIDNGRNSVEGLLFLYATYSYLYLTKVGITLKADEGMKATLSFMNSVLAEILHELNIAYFHKELGYSITDQAISYFLDNGEEGFYDHLDKVIEDMNKVSEEEEEADKIIEEVVADLKEAKEE